MKKFVLAAVATAMVASPVLAAAPAEAQTRHGYHQQRDYRATPQRGPSYNQRYTHKAPNYRTNWRKGERFDQRQARNYRAVNNWKAYQNRRLYAPPRGYQWVQSGNDAVLVALASGLIGAVIGGVFN